MGLFKSIFKAIPVVGSIISSSDSKKAVGKANEATQAGIANAQNTLQQQLATTTTNLTPWITTGQQANAGQAGLLGLNGADAQSSAIAGLQSSPLYQSLYKNGLDTILNNASATGGLRGGNTQSSLANFGSDTLTQVIQNQLANLGGVSSQGLSAANNLGQFGAQTAGSLADLATGSGQANAGAILGKQNIDNSLYSGLRQQVTNAISAGGGAGAIGAGGTSFNLSAAVSSLLGGSSGGITPSTSTPTGYRF